MVAEAAVEVVAVTVAAEVVAVAAAVEVVAVMAVAAEVVAVMAAAVVEIINHQSSYSLPIPSFTKGFFYAIIRAVDIKNANTIVINPMLHTARKAIVISQLFFIIHSTRHLIFSNNAIQ
jgi:uncharacterized membrane protein YvlD (DUF360 family)